MSLLISTRCQCQLKTLSSLFSALFLFSVSWIVQAELVEVTPDDSQFNCGDKLSNCLPVGSNGNTSGGQQNAAGGGGDDSRETVVEMDCSQLAKTHDDIFQEIDKADSNIKQLQDGIEKTRDVMRQNLDYLINAKNQRDAASAELDQLRNQRLDNCPASEGAGRGKAKRCPPGVAEIKALNKLTKANESVTTFDNTEHQLQAAIDQAASAIQKNVDAKSALARSAHDIQQAQQRKHCEN